MHISSRPSPKEIMSLLVELRCQIGTVFLTKLTFPRLHTSVNLACAIWFKRRFISLYAVLYLMLPNGTLNIMLLYYCVYYGFVLIRVSRGEMAHLF